MADQKVTFDILTRDRSTRALRGIGREALSTSDKFRRMARISGRTAKAAGVALGGAMVAAAGGLAAAAKAAAQEEQEIAVLRNTLRKTTKATEEQTEKVEAWITATQNATGVADGDLRPALGKLLIAHKDVGKAQSDMAVAMDISAARGLDLNTVVSAMAKAAQGNVGALGRLGVATKDAEGKTLSYDEVLRKASDTMGGTAAAAADTAAGRYKILKARFEDLKEAIGNKVLPALNDLMEWIDGKGIPALSRFSDWFSENVTPKIKALRDYVTEKLIPALKEFGETVLPTIKGNLEATAAAIDRMKKAWQELVETSDGSSGTMKALAGAVTLIGWTVEVTFTQISRVVANFLTILDKIVDVIDAIIDKTGAAVKGMKDIFTPNAPGTFNHLKDYIPGLATGGVVKARPGGTIVRLAEGGQDEAVVPLTNGGTAPTAGPGGVHIHGDIYVTGRDAMEAVRSLPQRLEQRAWLAGWAAV